MIDEVNAVQITAADYNGATWDGSPFSAGPTWILELVKNGGISPDTPNHTDYAEWWVQTPQGKVLATPGDWIIRDMKGQIFLVKQEAFQLKLGA
jgi:hypothetical protein